MGKVLSPEQVEFYRANGYLSPFRALAPAEARRMREAVDRFEREEGFSVGSIHFKGHLCFTRSFELARNPAILDVVEDLIGPDILVFASKFWIKQGRDGAFVSWHQDSAYFGLDPHEQVTAWVALTDATTANGCMRVIPGSNRGPAHRHVETYHEKNLLARGQRIDGVDEAAAVDLELEIGEFSLHHEHTVHGSLANETDEARIGLALFYIPTHVRSTIGRRTALLVRGADKYHHWDTDPAPRFDRDPLILEHMRRAHRRYTDRAVSQEADAT
jgi:ectoine hydroxylase-related dioxygenase (phytanoyl-CoA dioxygenase family)